MKYILTIEAPTLEGLIDKIEKELVVIKKDEKLAIEHDRRMRTRISPTNRKNKPWKETDVLFLIENYRKKDIRWIAGVLKRPINGVRARLYILYKSHNLPRLRPRHPVSIRKIED